MLVSDGPLVFEVLHGDGAKKEVSLSPAEAKTLVQQAREAAEARRDAAYNDPLGGLPIA